MKNNGKKLCAVAEEEIKAEDLIDEIYPYLAEFYEGEIVKDGGKVIFNFPNGQVFELSISEKTPAKP